MNQNKRFCIANWKMNFDSGEIQRFLSNFNNYLFDNNNVEVVLCPPHIYLSDARNFLKSGNFTLGAQNVHYCDKGSFTGEISSAMIADLSCKYVIIGHSERRILFNETNTLVKKKFDSVYDSSLTPILCVGESIDERNSSDYKTVLEKQITSILDSYGTISKDLVIAYEPVWAIGTGVSSSLSTIEKTHSVIKNIINKYTLKNCNIYVLYGGSVNQNNSKEIIALENVDGFLIGSASLNPLQLHKIYNSMGGS